MARVLSRKGVSIIDMEREQYEKSLHISLHKAINGIESPAKEKHVRSAILGSYKETGCNSFWSIVTKMPLHGQQIFCWKFCHVLHKLLLDGHGNVVIDSLKHVTLLEELQKLWNQVRDGLSYGRLISAYCNLLISKLKFHKKNCDLPNNLVVGEDMMRKLTGDDFNALFQLSAEIFDYMESLLALQESVFSSFDLSRSNSMTATGQCRLLPLISVLQECVRLYDMNAELLYKLHRQLPADTLSGHRDRFNIQFTQLHKFFDTSRNLTYFRTLISVPDLPMGPPNFLKQDVSPPVQEYISSQVIVKSENFDIVDNLTSDEVADSLVDMSQADTPIGPDSRDILIEQLMMQNRGYEDSLNMNKLENERFMSYLKDNSTELEHKLSDALKQIEHLTSENHLLTKQLQDILNTVTTDTVPDSESVINDLKKKGQVSEDKFVKMRDVYNKLREEHISLIRQNADVKKQMSKKEESDKVRAEQDIEVSVLQQSLDEKQLSLSSLRSDMENRYRSLLYELLKQSIQCLHNSMNDFNDDHYQNCSCTPDFVLEKVEQTDTLWKQFSDSVSEFQNSLPLPQGEGEGEGGGDSLTLPPLSVVSPIFPLCHTASDLLMFINTLCTSSTTTTTTTTTVNTEQQQQLLLLQQRVRDTGSVLGEALLGVLETFHDNDRQPLNTVDINSAIQQLKLALEDTVRHETSSTNNNINNDDDDDIGNRVEDELASTVQAIESATIRIEEMMRSSRETNTGLQLDVGEKILDSCTQLMSAIRILIEKSKNLQQELVSKGEDSSSASDFYKRNSLWTEGLISAAKSVGFSATMLVESADKVVSGEGKFEELIVCSHAIAANTVQLVAASRVKADRESGRLSQLETASKNVTEATARVVASSKHAAELIEEGDVMDFSSISLTQTKRLEMDSQVKVLELESSLTKERRRLGELRKRHYQLAGASEGWDDEDQS